MTVFSLFSGSSGNCVLIREKETCVLVDAGGSLKRISDSLHRVGEDLSSVRAILVTHEHSDHTAALSCILRKKGIPVYCLKKVAKELYLAALMKKDGSGDAAALAKWILTVEPGEEYEVGDLSFSPFSTPHDSADSCGYSFNGKTLGIATDLGTVTPEVRDALSGCESVILESNHDPDLLFSGPYPPYLKERVASENGHLNNLDCAAFAADLFRSGCRNLMLFHLSAENNDPDLALKTVRAALDEAGAFENGAFRLLAAQRKTETRFI